MNTPLGQYDTFLDLMRDFNVQVPAAKLSKWRLLYPNVGQLDGFPHFGNVLVCATDGVEALFHVDFSGTLWRGHLSAFNGPVAKDYVYPEDWDDALRKRKVNVFRRADGTFAIVPRDTFSTEYWSRHEKMSKEEQQIWESVGKGISIYEVDKALDQLRASRTKVLALSRTKPSASPRGKPSRRQQLLAEL